MSSSARHTTRRVFLAALFVCATCAACLAGLCAFLSSSASAVSSGAASAGEVKVLPIPHDAQSYAPGELIVELGDANASASIAEAAKRDIESMGVIVEEVLSPSSEYVGTTLLVSTGENHRVGDGLAEAAQTIASLRGIACVQPNYRYRATASADRIAKDDQVSQQYYLNDWESSHGANVAAAWEQLNTDAKVYVAVLDTGVYVMENYNEEGGHVVDEDTYHQEFDTGNLDLRHAVDFVNADVGQPIVSDRNPTFDDNGHGTHVAALIAARATTGATSDAAPVGIAGVSPNACVVPLKVLDAAGQGDTSDFVKAYSYLIRLKESDELKDLHVVNLSFSLMVSRDDRGSSEGSEGGEGNAADEGDDSDMADGAGDRGEGAANGRDKWTDKTGLPAVPDDDTILDNPAFQKCIAEARDCGIATVCAVGNREDQDVIYDSYPSAYEECISVTAYGDNGRDVAFANNNGDEDIAAPGTGIYSAWSSQADAYMTLDGTSQSTAIVSGVLSMLWAKNPNLSVQEAKEAIYGTATAEVLPLDASQESGSSDASAGEHASGGVAMAQGEPGKLSEPGKPDESAGVPTAQAVQGDSLRVGSVAWGGSDEDQQAKKHYAIDAAAALASLR